MTDKIDYPSIPAKRLCCPASTLESLRESSVEAVSHAQTDTPDLQDRELADR
jgi:hypothetical protein